MKINTDKCKVISNSHSNITIENENVENVEEFKFLGSVVPNLSLDVDEKQKDMEKQCKQQMGKPTFRAVQLSQVKSSSLLRH